ncbi:MAG TPA: MarR family transcriptional regulator [Chlamydiales bacterium]|nr:MarR family transcriptional regulator [Chlamydiales bacterium]
MKKVAWKKISHFEGPEESPGFLLWQVSTQWRRQIEAALATLGITHPQFVLLASIGWLTRDQEEISQVELARHCSMDITMTSQVLRSLEQKGFIERYKRAGNERSKYLHLTQKGAQLLEHALPLVESVDCQFFERLGKDTKKCIKLLAILAQHPEKS